MLTVRDIAEAPELSLQVAAGAEGLDSTVSWLHVSELEDPTPFLAGGEFLLTTGLGVGELAVAQRSYVRRLARHQLAGLGFGVGFGFAEPPAPLVDEAEKLGFPVVVIPYEVPFVAITKDAVTRLVNEQLGRVTRALEVNERLAEAVLQGRGVQALVGIVSSHLGCSLVLLDDRGRVVAERHTGGRASFEDALELALSDGAVLKAARGESPFGEYDLLVLHHGQTALGFELSRRRAVSAAELRLAGDLLEDLEADRLDDREAARRMAAFGLDPGKLHAGLLAVPTGNGASGEGVRGEVADLLDRRAVRYLSTARPDRAGFLIEVENEDEAARPCGAARRGGAFGSGRGRAARTGTRAGAVARRGARGDRRSDWAGRVLPRPRLARAAALVARRHARCLRRPRARGERGERTPCRVPHRSARDGLPLERRGRTAWHSPPYAPLSHGPPP